MDNKEVDNKNISEYSKEILEEKKEESVEPSVDDTLENDVITHHLSSMFQSWFLDYASYVILERAVPSIDDGLKPVQRRILHSMKRLDDGRYNKVANIVGHTMQFHPHGDASIGDALVQLGQKDLLIDCQGNWGNILTGDSAAASRYIEARLSKFALDVVFNNKTTEWKASYDGRNKEPVALPLKFPLLLAQGVEGIAVGLSSKILPHNFNELLDASIAYLQEKPFSIYPDFQTGGTIDVSKYNDGKRGGKISIRAKIIKKDKKTLAITELPYGKTTSTLIESIIRANDKGKIRIKKVEDNTAAEVEILVHLAAGTSSDKTIDALYAFSDCEYSLSPNCCVINGNKPAFLSVSDVLEKSVNNTKHLLEMELLIHKNEILESLHFASLERIFIEQGIYKDKEFEESKNMTIAITHIETRLQPFIKKSYREVTKEDILKLMEIKMARILKFNATKADNLIRNMKKQLKEIEGHLDHLVDYTIDWFVYLKDKYGKLHPRLTKIRSFETIVAEKVVEATEKLYFNKEEGFIGTGLKKSQFVCHCSNIDNIILFYRTGKYKIIRVDDKIFVGKNVMYINIFKKNDKRMVYNVIFRDGKEGSSYIKRFNITSVVVGKDYDITRGEEGSRVLYFSANPNGEAEVVKTLLKPKLRLKRTSFETDFSEVLIKGRNTKGNLHTRNAVKKITLKQRGESTLGGRKVWFDADVLRLNYDDRGAFLGEFNSTDKLIVLSQEGSYYLTNFDISNHFDPNYKTIEKFVSEKVWTVVYFDADHDKITIKRFCFEPIVKETRFIGNNPKSYPILVTDTPYPRLKIVFGGEDDFRAPLILEVDEFIRIMNIKAYGKRVSNYSVQTVEEIEPIRFLEEKTKEENTKLTLEEEFPKDNEPKTLFDED